MKKLMSLMLGMSLVFGAATVAFAQDAPKDTTPTKTKKKGSKKKTDPTTKTDTKSNAKPATK